MDLFYHELQCLVSSLIFKGAAAFMFAVSERASEYHLVISYYDCLRKCCHPDLLLLLGVDYAIDMSKHET